METKNNKNLKKIKIYSCWVGLFFVSIINITLLVLNLYGTQKKDWILKINEKTVLKIKDFESEYKAFVDFQSLNQPLVSKSEIKKVKEDPTKKNLYLKNVLNDLLILKYAQKKGLINKKKLQNKTKNISKIIQRLMIKQRYLQQEIIPKAKKLDTKLVAKQFKKLSTNAVSKGWSIKKRKEEAENQARIMQLQKHYINNIDKLRSTYRIKVNNEYTNF